MNVRQSFPDPLTHKALRPHSNHVDEAGYTIPSASEVFARVVSRRLPFGPALKSGVTGQANGREEKYQAGGREGTHTTLRCCVFRSSGKAHNSAMYAPSRSSSCFGKALLCRAPLCSGIIEPAYFNRLTPRPFASLLLAWGR